MATGVVGTSGVNARKSVGLAIKHEIGFATTHQLLMEENPALPVVQVIQNLGFATIRVVQVRFYKTKQIYVEQGNLSWHTLVNRCM